MGPLKNPSPSPTPTTPSPAAIASLDAALRQSHNNHHYITLLCTQWSGAISLLTLLMGAVDGYNIYSQTSALGSSPLPGAGASADDAPSWSASDPRSRVYFNLWGMFVTLLSFLVQPATTDFNLARRRGLVSIRSARIAAWVHVLAFGYFYQATTKMGGGAARGGAGEGEGEGEDVAAAAAAGVGGVRSLIMSAHASWPLPVDSIVFFMAWMSGNFLRSMLRRSLGSVRELERVARGTGGIRLVDGDDDGGKGKGKGGRKDKKKNSNNKTKKKQS